MKWTVIITKDRKACFQIHGDDDEGDTTGEARELADELVATFDGWPEAEPGPFDAAGGRAIGEVVE